MKLIPQLLAALGMVASPANSDPAWTLTCDVYNAEGFNGTLGNAKTAITFSTREASEEGAAVAAFLATKTIISPKADSYQVTVVWDRVSGAESHVPCDTHSGALVAFCAEYSDAPTRVDVVDRTTRLHFTALTTEMATMDLFALTRAYSGGVATNRYLDLVLDSLHLRLSGMQCHPLH